MINKIIVKDNLLSRSIVLVFCILLILFREFDLILFPRFWAEEGQLFYPFALHHSSFEIFTTPLVGYLTLFNSIVSTLQAKIFSIQNVPVVSTYLGFVVQFIPVCIIVFSSHIFWNTIFKKAVCAIIIIVVTAPEIWLNTTNSHFVFGLITFLIMVIGTDDLSKFKKQAFRFLLIIGGLTGPASMFLSPVFIYSAYKKRSREKSIQAVIIGVCAVLQASVIVYTLLFSNSYQRLEQHSLSLTVNAFFIDNFSLNTNRLVCGIAIALFYIYLLIKYRKSSDHLIFLLSFLIVSVFSTLGSLNMQGAPRYAYLPTCILMLLIASVAFELDLKQLNFKHGLSTAVLILSIALSFVYYKYRMQYVYTDSLPKWKDEIAKYEIDKSYKPKIHPDYLYVQF